MRCESCGRARAFLRVTLPGARPFAVCWECRPVRAHAPAPLRTSAVSGPCVGWSRGCTDHYACVMRRREHWRTMKRNRRARARLEGTA